MSVKHAVLALVTERRGYGYELAQRFQDRVGPGWQLNAAAIYPALDQLEQAGLVTATAQRGTRRSPRLVYTATAAGEAAVAAWLQMPGPATAEPVRSELHLRLAFARSEHRQVLAGQLAAHERACEELLARCAAATRPQGEAGAARALIDAGVAARMQAELAWLRDVRARLEAA